MSWGEIVARAIRSAWPVSWRKTISQRLPVAKRTRGTARNGTRRNSNGRAEDVQVAKDVRRNLPHPQVVELIKWSDTGICVDSYLQHAFWEVGKPAIVLFGISDPLIFGHPENLNLLRDRKYLRPQQFDLYYVNQYCNEAFVSPEEVIEALNNDKR